MNELYIAQHLRTLRHLRADQVMGRLRKMIRPLWEQPIHFSRQGVRPFPGCGWSPRRQFLPPRTDANPAHDVIRGVLSFLNRREYLGWPIPWRISDLPLLWRFHLHYFDYLWSLAFDQAQTVTRDWIAEHPLHHRHVGWHPYPISVRLLNWCAYFFGKMREKVDAEPAFAEEIWRSMFLQAEWLRRHLETDLGANHLLENGAALAFAGACFRGEQAQAWGRIGRSVLRRELGEQVLEDGVHIERSPMYQSRLVCVLANLLNSGDPELADIVIKPLRRMSSALSVLHHPDGGIALLNDSALRVCQDPDRLIAYVRELDQRVRAEAPENDGAFALKAAGYYGWRSSEGTYLVCDAGDLGPDYNPGHAHGDLLSFELSLRGQRIIVDAGVHDYGDGYLRQYCRSTQAHNTVEVDGCDQAEFWGRFRVARRAYPHDIAWQPWSGGFQLTSWHDGYARLRGRPKHSRTFVWHSPDILIVGDRVAANTRKVVRSRIHFHPACRLDSMDRDCVVVVSPEGPVRVKCAGARRLGVEFTHFCPEFGRCQESPTLVLTATGADVEMGYAVVLTERMASLDLAATLLNRVVHCPL